MNDDHCGGASGSCEAVARKCFLTGGSSTPGSFHVGTGTLLAAGAAAAPVTGVSHPTLASVFCANPTSNPSINTVIGLPGPGRATVSGTLRLQP